MNAAELRIGNIIQHGEFNSSFRIISFYGGNQALVDSAHVKFPTDDQFEPLLSECSGVKITVKWLERFGFITFDAEVDMMEYGMSGHDNFSLFNDGGLNFVDEEPFYIEYRDKKIQVDYIHQLQNLYFALTGEELTIK